MSETSGHVARAASDAAAAGRAEIARGAGEAAEDGRAELAREAGVAAAAGRAVGVHDNLPQLKAARAALKRELKQATAALPAAGRTMNQLMIRHAFLPYTRRPHPLVMQPTS